MIVSTKTEVYQKLFATNQTGPLITAPIPTAVAPTGDGIFNSESTGVSAIGSNMAAISFYGTRTATDNETFTARITGWRRINTLWVPTPLLTLALTQGTSVGIASADVVATEYFADTITVSSALTSAYEIISPADNNVATVKIDMFGCEKIQVQLAKGTNASCNALIAGF